ncbi:hypothetical protein DPMN_011865 [Dreissena polymorpha]|uniref:Carboxylic ester hydrolase n=2 Tax=Dreissena polymorpha TaxID=45954 RepID=A0A9D4N4U1_DREPO|nr:hypothetical protein DPMN_011865 [Dreissena polymorpha]
MWKINVKTSVTAVQILFCITLAHATGPTVISRLGVINGNTRNGEFNGKVYAVNEYLGIPYAMPPVGDLRFKRPEPFGNLTSPFNATRYGNMCPQSDFLQVGVRSTTEDCLFLNIFVPTTPKDLEQGHAVMVFIHGGGFTMGSGEQTPGHVLSWFGNVIVVTINYRLGLFGFLNIGNDDAKGNQGLWDQRLALQWVQANIGEFGGDAGRVTIFGESAGAIQVTLQCIYPANRGLFQNAIAESGTLNMKYGLTENTKYPAQLLAHNLNCESDTNAGILKCLQNASSENLLEEIDKLSLDPNKAALLKFVPTIDGQFFLQDPFDTLREAAHKLRDEVKFLREIRLINGVNGMEGGMYLMFVSGNFTGDPDQIRVSGSEMKTTWIPAFLGQEMPGKEIHESVKQLVAYEYTNWGDYEDAREMFVKYTGDLHFNVPAVMFSKVHANDSNAKSWFYRFEPRLERHSIATPTWLQKANHGDELGPVFGYSFDYEKYANIKNYTPPNWEYGLSERIMRYWTNFAKFGDPNGNGSVFWPQYDPDKQQNIFIDRQDSIGHYLYAKEVAFWSELLPSVMDDIGRGHAHAYKSEGPQKANAACDTRVPRWLSVLGFWTLMSFAMKH